METSSKHLMPNMHDVAQGLFVSRAMAEVIADRIEQSDPQAATALERFAEEVGEVWKKHYPLLPTNMDIHLALERLNNDAQVQNSSDSSL